MTAPNERTAIKAASYSSKDPIISTEFSPLCHPGYRRCRHEILFSHDQPNINNAFNSELLFSYYSSGWTLCKIAFSFTFPRHFPCQCINFLLAEQSTALETTVLSAHTETQSSFSVVLKMT